MGDISTTFIISTKILELMEWWYDFAKKEQLNAKLRRLRFYGAEKTYYAIEHGYNSRLDEIQAAILLTKLPKLDQYVERRREIAALYNELLTDTELILPAEAEYGKHAYYLNVVRHPRR
jgi:aminotransferase EvaB